MTATGCYLLRPDAVNKPGLEQSTPSQVCRNRAQYICGKLSAHFSCFGDRASRHVSS